MSIYNNLISYSSGGGPITLPNYDQFNVDLKTYLLSLPGFTYTPGQLDVTVIIPAGVILGSNSAAYLPANKAWNMFRNGEGTIGSWGSVGRHAGASWPFPLLSDISNAWFTCSPFNGIIYDLDEGNCKTLYPNLNSTNQMTWVNEYVNFAYIGRNGGKGYAALYIEGFVSGDKINIINNGYIVGEGGRPALGGSYRQSENAAWDSNLGSWNYSNQTAKNTARGFATQKPMSYDGGNALYVDPNGPIVNITNNGTIAGGGGGGESTYYAFSPPDKGSMGGGGAGAVPGNSILGGTFPGYNWGGTNPRGVYNTKGLPNGNPATVSAYTGPVNNRVFTPGTGVDKNGGSGGTGGALGQSGGKVINITQNISCGGRAGFYAVGDSKINWVVPGTRLGRVASGLIPRAP